jgi:hypothetical protein
MNQSAQSTSVIGLARQIAAAHPGATLACPVCPAGVNAANLDRHLAKLHPAELNASGQGGPLRISGIDRRIRMVAIGLMVAWAIGVTAAIAALGPALNQPIPSAIVGGLGVACVGFIALASLGAFKARLELVGEQLRLRWLFGLGSRAVTLPAKLETGTLLERKTSAMHTQRNTSEGEAVAVGSYLRLRGGGSITIGVKPAAGLGKRWAQGGWTKAKKTRWVDIEIDRMGLVALEYHLAARRQLMPRS